MAFLLAIILIFLLRSTDRLKYDKHHRITSIILIILFMTN